MGWIRPLRRSLALGLLLAAVVVGQARGSTPAGTTITNTAFGAYHLVGVADTVRTPSNSVTLITRGGRTPAILEFLRHAPGAPDAEWVRVSRIDTTLSLPLLPAVTFSPGDVVVMRLTDRDQDIQRSSGETVAVELAVNPLGDHELVLLHETGPGTGVFAGSMPSRLAARAIPGNGRLEARTMAEVTGHYVDFVDPTDTAADIALFAGEGARLHLDKSSARARAAIGDIVEYTLRVANPDPSESAESERATLVRLVDDLPRGFRYRPGTTLRDGRPTGNPEISSDGRQLVFSIGDLEPGEPAAIRYAVEIGAGSRSGEAINSAEAVSSSGLTSNRASASILVADDFFRHGFISGRVTVGSCDSTAVRIGVAGVRLFLEDGTWTATDGNGRYHFLGVPGGMHVVALDRESLPPGLIPADCPTTHRFARSLDSQFVPLSEGTLWRADFLLERGVGERGGTEGDAPVHSVRGNISAHDSTRAAPQMAPPTVLIESLTPGDEWLWPTEGYNPSIPGLAVMVKHAAKATIELTNNGRAVPAVNLSGTSRNADGTVAVTNWAGIDLVIGENRLVVRLEQDGTVTTLTRTIHYSGPPVDVSLATGESRLVADGLTSPIVAVRLVDRDGHPARERVVGTFHVDPPYRSMSQLDAQRDNPLATTPAPQYQVGPDGIARIALEPTHRAGEVVLRFPFDGRMKEVRAWLSPSDRGWMLVGLADGTVGYRTMSDHTESLDANTSDGDYYSNGRLAFYARGRVKGEWLLTLAMDTNGGRPGPSADLDRVIDPDSYYTLYGDATAQDYDAPTSGKVYVRIEQRQFYALFGDTDAGLARTELSRYNRRISGFKSEYRGRHAGWTAFAAESESRFVRREIRGNGTSGPYDLDHLEMVLNSEQVTIETRDRFRSEIILRSAIMHRHTDYDIDYAAGTLFFREPIFSQDAEFNPIFLVITFESRDPESNRIQAGGRASLHLAGGAVETGLTGIYNEDGTSPGRLAGGDIQWHVDPMTTVRGEGAWSENGDGRQGSAWLAQLERHGGRLDGTAWFRRQAAGFGLAQQNQSEQGIEKYGADLSWHATRADRATLQAWRELNLSSGSRRDVGAVGIQHDAGRLNLRAGLRHAEDDIPGRPEAISDQLTAGGDVRFFRGRLSLKADHHQSIGDRGANVDYPTRTLLGADWRVMRNLSLIVAQEFTNGPSVDTRATRVGLTSEPWSGGEVATSLSRRGTEEGSRLFANLGLHQKWRLSDRWFMDAGLDHSRTIGTPESLRVNPAASPASSGVADFVSASVGAARHGDKWQWNGRAEYFNSRGERRWTFAPSFLIQPREALGVAFGGRLFLTRGPVERTRADLRASLAIRPDDSPWVALNRLDLVVLDESGGSSEIREWRLIDNLHINRSIGSHLQATVQYGGKYIEQTVMGRILSGYTDLWGLDLRRDIADNLDVGLSGGVRHSWTPGLRDYHAGVSAGYILARGVWLQGGYNITGFEEEDFSGSAVTSHGPYLRLSAILVTDALTRLGFGGHSKLRRNGGTP